MNWLMLVTEGSTSFESALPGSKSVVLWIEEKEPEERRQTMGERPLGGIPPSNQDTTWNGLTAGSQKSAS